MRYRSFKSNFGTNGTGTKVKVLECGINYTSTINFSYI